RGPRLACTDHCLDCWRGPRPAGWRGGAAPASQALAATSADSEGDTGGATGGAGSAWCTPGCQHATREVEHPPRARPSGHLGQMGRHRQGRHGGDGGCRPGPSSRCRSPAGGGVRRSSPGCIAGLRAPPE
ncbi:unnamed protein product, partial [Laminaria digitata]